MADLNVVDFNGRVKRIKDAHRRGRGFEAAGTRRREAARRSRRFRVPVIRPLLILFITLVVLKTLIFIHLGPSTYQARVAELRAGTGVESVGATLMQADPLTSYLATQVTSVLR